MKKESVNVPVQHTKPFSSIEINEDQNEMDNGVDAVKDDEFFIKKSIQENPQKGVELLFSRYYAPLCNHAIKFVGSKEVAEDIVSEIFYQFYSNKTYETITVSFRAYLFKSVRNRGYNYLKREVSRNTSQFESLDLIDIPSEEPEHATDYEELYQDFETAINSLPISRRKIYLLYQIEGFSMKEIATKLSISPKTVDVQLYRARKTIREIIKNKWFSYLLLFLMH